MTARGSGPRVLAVRQDNAGDVLLAGPAVRALADRASAVTLLAGPRGRAAADLLLGVDRVVEWCAPWIDPEPGPVGEAGVAEFAATVRSLQVDAAVVFTSFHQSPLPLALLLRLAGVPWIGGISEDYPGSLLDLRHRSERDQPEPERALSLARAAGFALADGDDGRLAVRRPLPDVEHLTGPSGYVVVHPGASAPAREWSTEQYADAVAALAGRGERVVVTGSREQKSLTAEVAAGGGLDLGGTTDFAELAAVLDRARVVVAPNTGPAHLAAAVGTPVVSLFAPVVRAARWAPYGVPTAVLGDQHAPCQDTRARVCPVSGHPCLSKVTTEDVLRAVDRVAEEVAR